MSVVRERCQFDAANEFTAEPDCVREIQPETETSPAIVVHPSEQDEEIDAEGNEVIQGPHIKIQHTRRPPGATAEY